MTDEIRLTGLRARGFHGVFPEERREGQMFVVDVVLHLDLSPAGLYDRLDLTVDYAGMAKRIVAAIEGDPVDLIESLAERVAGICLGHRGVEAVDVTIHKPEAPLGLEFADVSVAVRRGKNAIRPIAGEQHR